MDLPVRFLRPFLGPRIVKTGLAVFLSLVAFHWIGSNYGTFAGVAAVLAVQPSVARARQVFWQQLSANLIGGAVGGAMGYWLGTSAATMALGVVLVLGLCTRLKLSEAAGIAVVAVLFIMERPEHDFLLYTAARVGSITGGMIIGALVNRFIRPPNYRERVREELRDAAEAVSSFAGHLTASLASPEHYRKEQIKTEAKAITQRLETAGIFLEMDHEANRGDSRLLVLDKARASMYVYVERIMDIHKIVLQLGGLTPGEELDTVAGALRAVVRFKDVVMAGALEGRVPSGESARMAAEAMARQESMVAIEVDDPARRQRGLALHSVLTNIRHMSWRMESLSRLLGS